MINTSEKHFSKMWNYINKDNLRQRVLWENIPIDYLIYAFDHVKKCSLGDIRPNYFVDSDNRFFVINEFKIELEFRGYFKEQERLKKLKMI